MIEPRTLIHRWWLISPGKVSFAAAVAAGPCINGGLWLWSRHDIDALDFERRMNVPSGATFFFIAVASLATNTFAAARAKKKTR